MSRENALRLYKALIRESNKFPAYNFRNYALRRVRDGFRENSHLEDPQLIKTKLEDATRNLELIKRQVVIGQLYSTEKLVIEH